MNSLARLVRLQVADQVPLDSVAANFVDLALSFLYLILTENTEAGVDRVADNRGGMRLAHGDELDLGRIAAGTSRGIIDPLPDIIDVYSQIGHALDFT